MPIETLYLIPIIAFGVFLFILTYSMQKRSDRGIIYTKANALKQEVQVFNEGGHTSMVLQRNIVEQRLEEVESRMQELATGISSQQKTLEQYHTTSAEVDGLKGKLQKMSAEYEMMLGENHQLRARLRKLMESLGSVPIGDGAVRQQFVAHENESGTSYTLNVPPIGGASAAASVNTKLYADTRLIKLSSVTNLDDTTEIDLGKR